MKHILFVLFILSSLSFAQESDPEAKVEFEEVRKEYFEYYSQMDGIWEGEIESHELQGDYPDKAFKYKMRFIVEGDKIRLIERHEGKWYNVAYEYKIIRNGTNAIIYTHSQGGAWVETFNFTVTLETIDELGIVWSRIVNNYLSEEKTKEARGYFQGFSTFKRVKNIK